MASSGAASLSFINDATHDGSIKMNLEVYRNTLTPSLKKDTSNLIGKSLIIFEAIDPKQTKAEFIGERGRRL